MEELDWVQENQKSAKLIVDQLRFLKNFEEETSGLNEFQKKLMREGAVSCLHKELAKFQVLTGHEIL
jgi:hypothetical protein